MRFFLDSFIGNGEYLNAFRPAHADGNYSIIDLRGVSTVPDGVCLVGAAGFSGTPLMDFGDILDQKLKGNMKRALANRLGLTLELDDLRGIIAELMLLHGRQDGTRWKPLQATNQGRHEIFLGGETVYDAPVIEGTVITDDFNRANDAELTDSAEGWSWTEVNGGQKLDTNQTKMVDASTVNTVRAESALATVDMYAQVKVVGGGNAVDGGPTVRYAAAAYTFYAGVFRVGNDRQIYETTTGSFTNILDDNTSPADGSICRIEANGSSIGVLDDGTHITGAGTHLANHPALT